MPITADGIIVPRGAVKKTAAPKKPKTPAGGRRSFKTNRPNLQIGSSYSYKNVKGQYVHPDLEDDPSDDPYAQADVLLTSRIAAVIEKHYAGHPWMIEVSHAQRCAFISIPLFMGATKWVLHIDKLSTDPGLRAVVRACGEILERYKIPRQSFSPDHFMAALQGIPKHRRGRTGLIPT